MYNILDDETALASLETEYDLSFVGEGKRDNTPQSTQTEEEQNEN